MTTYSKANTSTYWYQDDYPGAAMDPNAGVLHDTETTSMPGYSGGAEAPNYTAVPNFKAQRLDWFAHFPDERSSRALVNAPGGVETNTLNVIQVELVGTCAPATHAEWKAKGIPHIYWPEAPQWALDDLAEFVAWMNKRHGIPVQGPSGRWTAYPASYGPGGQRFTFARWKSFRGWCGHQHVPENVHGDPGALNWGYVAKKANALLGNSPVHPTPPPAPKPKSPRWDAIFAAALEAEKALGNKPARARRKALKVIKDQAARFSVTY